MDKLTALLQLLLALFGIDVGDRTLIHDIDTATTRLYSRTLVEGRVIRFECLRSASGQCHYAVYPRGCGNATAIPRRCESAPMRWFEIDSGQARRVDGLAGSRLCVGPDRERALAHCQPLE